LLMRKRTSVAPFGPGCIPSAVRLKPAQVKFGAGVQVEVRVKVLDGVSVGVRVKVADGVKVWVGVLVGGAGSVAFKGELFCGGSARRKDSTMALRRACIRMKGAIPSGVING